jgi:PAS domain S-box-containing protein
MILKSDLSDQFLDSLTFYMVRTDISGNYTYVNKKFVDVYGWLYPDGQIIGKYSLSSICEHDHAKVKIAVGECIDEPGRVVKVEIDKPAKDGSTQTTIWDFICHTSSDGTPSEIQCVGIDITDRIKAERTLKESVERFEIITNATNDAIWDYDFKNGRIFRGQGFKTLFGYESGYFEPEPMELLELVHPEDQEWLTDKFTAMFQPDCRETNWDVEYRLRRVDGSYAYVVEKGVYIRNQKGVVIRAVGATSDISHRREYEESLKKLNAQLSMSNQDLEQFAYITSHDLQEPLRMVSSFMTLLEKKYGNQLDAKALQYISFATEGAKRMRQIILDLLEFSRVGTYQDHPTSVPLNDVVNECLSLYKRIITEKKAVITVGELPTVTFYQAPLSQIFQNLMANAIRYNKNGLPPEVNIFSIEHTNEYEIVVADKGIGIAPENFEKIFVIFQRLNPEEEYEGTGVGLPIVKKILHRMGGRIWVESEQGVGSEFHFTIPKMPHRE